MIHCIVAWNWAPQRGKKPKKVMSEGSERLVSPNFFFPQGESGTRLTDPIHETAILARSQG